MMLEIYNIGIHKISSKAKGSISNFYLQLTLYIDTLNEGIESQFTKGSLQQKYGILFQNSTSFRENKIINVFRYLNVNGCMVLVCLSVTCQSQIFSVPDTCQSQILSKTTQFTLICQHSNAMSRYRFCTKFVASLTLRVCD